MKVNASILALLQGHLHNIISIKQHLNVLKIALITILKMMELDSVF